MTAPPALPPLTPDATLPRDAARATLVGRLWQPGVGPVVVGVRGGDLVDLSPLAPTASQLFELDDVGRRVSAFTRSTQARVVADHATTGPARKLPVPSATKRRSSLP